jgi:hypothetical protein
MASLLHFVSEKAIIGKADQVRVCFTLLTLESIVTYLRVEE